MMPWVRSALQAWVTGDQQGSQVQAGSTDTVVKLAAGQVAAEGWEDGDVIRYKAASGSGDLHDSTARVLSIAGDDLTLDPGLTDAAGAPLAAVAGDDVLAGADDWLSPDAGWVYWKNALTSPATRLFEQVRDSDVVVAYGDPSHRPEIFTRVRSEWGFVVLGRDPAWIEGFTWRVFQKLNHRRDRLAVNGRDVYELVIEGSELQMRADDLHQRIMTLSIVTASKDGRP